MISRRRPRRRRPDPWGWRHRGPGQVVTTTSSSMRMPPKPPTPPRARGARASEKRVRRSASSRIAGHHVEARLNGDDHPRCEIAVEAEVSGTELVGAGAPWRVAGAVAKVLEVMDIQADEMPDAVWSNRACAPVSTAVSGSRSAGPRQPGRSRGLDCSECVHPDSGYRNERGRCSLAVPGERRRTQHVGGG